MKKKGSLSLSINAIVVLILAVAMLGLGLGFTKTMFSKFGSQFKIDAPSNPATLEDPISLPENTVTISSVKETRMDVNFYSNNGGNIAPTMSCACVNSAGAAPTSGTALAALATNPTYFISEILNPGEQKGFTIIIPPQTGASGSSCLCTVSFTDGSAKKSKQITLNIQ
ncbi:hypothetical protein AUJ68_05155 [Candidatus Woesearchaeota archaeon CG1_02_57_44]|nr:MAG: hypothetical protein AUJ68_05155 [Candidatus Woesearchaeota archaeon CG1_02_57_44]PIN69999.1 MAG: hypothetical protein COV94_02255 [Candidatus Woesearchaeota archaeon CG11_big_fil_rev_8_21_14_0_20_57_5]